MVRIPEQAKNLPFAANVADLAVPLDQVQAQRRRATVITNENVCVGERVAGYDLVRLLAEFSGQDYSAFAGLKTLGRVAEIGERLTDDAKAQELRMPVSGLPGQRDAAVSILQCRSKLIQVIRDRGPLVQGECESNRIVSGFELPDAMADYARRIRGPAADNQRAGIAHLGQCHRGAVVAPPGGSHDFAPQVCGLIRAILQVLEIALGDGKRNRQVQPPHAGRMVDRFQEVQAFGGEPS